MNALTPVDSKMIRAHGYDPATRTLAVHFHGNDGAVHHFKDVPDDVAAGFAAADSHGRYFNAHIRDKYDHDLVDIADPKEPADAA